MRSKFHNMTPVEAVKLAEMFRHCCKVAIECGMNKEELGIVFVSMRQSLTAINKTLEQIVATPPKEVTTDTLNHLKAKATVATMLGISPQELDQMLEKIPSE